MEKICKMCGILKPLSEYSKDKVNSDGHKGSCKVCRNTDRRNKINFIPEYFLGEKYSTISKRCKNNKAYQGKLHITREQFVDWGIPALEEFVKRNEFDMSTGYIDKNISIDKIDDEAGYKLGNLQFLLRKDNIDKELIKYRRTVLQYTVDNRLVATHQSIEDAAKSLNKEYGTTTISHALNGRAKTAYGYKWEYKEECNNGV